MICEIFIACRFIQYHICMAKQKVKTKKGLTTPFGIALACGVAVIIGAGFWFVNTVISEDETDSGGTLEKAEYSSFPCARGIPEVGVVKWQGVPDNTAPTMFKSDIKRTIKESHVNADLNQDGDTDDEIVREHIEGGGIETFTPSLPSARKNRIYIKQPALTSGTEINVLNENHNHLFISETQKCWYVGSY